MKRFFKSTLTATALLAAGSISTASAESITGIPGARDVAFAGCGWYVVLGCSRSFNGGAQTMTRLGGPFAGGGAGLKVANTSEYPNFNNGWYCVVDGPYTSRSQAGSIAWTEAVPDAYVKSGC
ncbi:MAG: hypothetical protein AAFO77_01310 [Pseudomonadota bacterium]